MDWAIRKYCEGGLIMARYQVDVHAVNNERAFTPVCRDSVFQRYIVEAESADDARIAAIDATYDKDGVDYINPLDVVAVPL
jgi:hypothetical protein